MPVSATTSSTLGSSGGSELKPRDVVRQELPRAVADRLEHVLARRAVRDRALDAGEALEQLLALLERLEQPLVQLGLGLRLVALAALLRGEPEEPQREPEHARHPARQMELVELEPAATGARDHERGGHRVVHRDRERRALAEAGHRQAVGVPGGDAGESAPQALVAREADRRDDLAAAHAARPRQRRAPWRPARRPPGSPSAPSSADETAARKPVSCWVDQVKLSSGGRTRW